MQNSHQNHQWHDPVKYHKTPLSWHHSLSSPISDTPVKYRDPAKRKNQGTAMNSQRFSPEGIDKELRVSLRTQAYDTFIELSALRFMGGGGGGGPFLARDGGGGGACFFPF